MGQRCVHHQQLAVQLHRRHVHSAIPCFHRRWLLRLLRRHQPVLPPRHLLLLHRDARPLPLMTSQPPLPRCRLLPSLCTALRRRTRPSPLSLDLVVQPPPVHSLSIQRAPPRRYLSLSVPPLPPYIRAFRHSYRISVFPWTRSPLRCKPLCIPLCK